MKNRHLKTSGTTYQDSIDLSAIDPQNSIEIQQQLLQIGLEQEDVKKRIQFWEQNSTSIYDQIQAWESRKKGIQILIEEKQNAFKKVSGADYRQITIRFQEFMAEIKMLKQELNK